MFACFHVGGIELAFSTRHLQEVVVFPEEMTPATAADCGWIGSFELRGVSIPTLDVAAFLGLPPSEVIATRRIAIVQVGTHRLGLCMDATSEILMVSAENISSFDNPPSGPRSVIRRVLKLKGGDRLVEVFEPEALALVKGIPEILSRSLVVEDTSKIKKSGPRRQCITFQSGNHFLALPMEGIREIIRLPQVQRSVLAVDYCLGMFNLRGMIVPLIDFNSFLTNEPARNVTALSDSLRVVLVRVNEIQVGLLVDTVNSIESFYADDMNVVTGQDAKLEAMMEAYVQLADGKNVLLLQESKILNDCEVIAISRGHKSLYGHISKDHTKHKKATDRKMYLCFKLQYHLSTRLNSIEEIARPDENMVRPPGSPDFVVGMQKLRNEMVMIVDLKNYYGLGQVTDFDNSRVIITRGAKGKYGFLVDAVESIETVDESEKIKLPVFLARDVINNLQGDMNEVVEMNDMSGTKKTFMILDLPELVRKLELKTA